MKTNVVYYWKRRMALMDVPHWFLLAQALVMGIIAIVILTKLIG